MQLILTNWNHLQTAGRVVREGSLTNILLAPRDLVAWPRGGHMPLFSLQAPLLLAHLLLVAGCTPTSGEDEVEELDPCAEGYLLDSDTCVPAACGVGTWGDLPVDAGTVYVSADTAEGGDGSVDLPLRSLQAAMDLSGSRGGGLVAVAAGSYPEVLDLGTDHGGVHLAGRCRDLVTLDASVGDSRTSGISIVAGGAELTFSGLTVKDATYDALAVKSGRVTVRDAAFVGAVGAGLFAYRTGLLETSLTLDSVVVADTKDYGIMAMYEGTTITMVDTLVQGVGDNGSGGLGVGLLLSDGAVIEAERTQIVGSAALGAIAMGEGTMLTLRDSTVRDTLESPNPSFALTAVGADEGAVITLERSEVVGNVGAGVTVLGEGSRVVLVDSVVRDTISSEGGGDGMDCGDGFGLLAMAGGRIEAEASEITGNTGVGVVASGTGSSMALRQVTVRDTRTDDNGLFGIGVQVTGGATLEADECEIAMNRSVGVMVAQPGSWMTLTDTVVWGTMADDQDLPGSGIQVSDGAHLTATRCEITENLAVGIVANDDGTSVVLQDCVVRGNLQDPIGGTSCGIAAHDGASIQVDGGEVAANAEVGVMVSGEGTTLTLAGTVVRDSTFNADGDYGSGAFVTRGGTLRAEGVDIVGNGGVGLVASEYGTRVFLVGGHVRDTHPGWDGTGGFGVQVTQGATLDAVGTAFTGNTSAGVLIGEGGSQAMFRGGSITGTKNAYGEQGMAPLGLAIQNDATVVAEGLLVADNEGPGLYVAGQSADLICQDCTVARNQFAGATLVDGGSLTAHDTTFTETGTSANLGGGVGVWSAVTDDSDTPTVTLMGCSVSGNPIAGIWLQGDGSYDISDSVISGGEGLPHGAGTRCGDAVFAGSGVTAWNGTTGLRLSRNVLQDAAGAGIFLEAADAWLDSNTFAQNAIDLLSQGEVCTGVPEGWDDAGTALLCPSSSGGYEWPTCDLRFSLVMFTEDVEARGARSLRLPPLPPVEAPERLEGHRPVAMPVGRPR